MKITELNGEYAKISKTSITVKGNDGKTIGVIIHCYELAPRDASEIWSKVRNAVGLNAANCISKMRRVGTDIWYLENINNPDPNADLLRDAGFNVATYKRLA